MIEIVEPKTFPNSTAENRFLQLAAAAAEISVKRKGETNFLIRLRVKASGAPPRVDQTSYIAH